MTNLLLDCNNLCHIAYHGIKNDLTSNEMPTSAIFGFLSQLIRLKKAFVVDEIIFAWDSRKSYRKKVYPEYKANRNKKDQTKEEIMERKQLFKQISLLRKEIIPDLGFKNNFIQIGYEADDLIAKTIIDNRDQEFIIVSTDQDLFQLLQFNNCYIYNSKTKKKTDKKKFTENYGIDPIYWDRVKAIAGCSSDNILGIKGVGEKTAIKYLNNSCTEKVIEKIKNQKQLIHENNNLTLLPYQCGDNLMKKIILKKSMLKKMDFINVFEKYQMNSFLKQKTFSTWVKYFNIK